MHRLVCGLQLASLNAGDTPAAPLNNKALAVAPDRLLCAAPCCLHRLVYVPPCMWTPARFARWGGQGRNPLKYEDSYGGYQVPFCVHRLVYAPPWSAARFTGCGGPPLHRPQKKKLLWCLRTTFCLHLLVYKLPCMCTALCMCRLVYVDYGMLRSTGGTSLQRRQIRRLVRWLQTAFGVHHLVSAPPCERIALYGDYGPFD